MIITENFAINGTAHVRNYSDRYMVASDDGVEYEVAEDLATLGKVYHETETLIDRDATPEEIADALEEIL